MAKKNELFSYVYFTEKGKEQVNGKVKLIVSFVYILPKRAESKLMWQQN